MKQIQFRVIRRRVRAFKSDLNSMWNAEAPDDLAWEGAKGQENAKRELKAVASGSRIVWDNCHSPVDIFCSDLIYKCRLNVSKCQPVVNRLEPVTSWAFDKCPSFHDSAMNFLTRL